MYGKKHQPTIIDGHKICGTWQGPSGLLCNVSFQFTRIPNMLELLKLWNQLAESLDDPEHNEGRYDWRLNFSLCRTVMYFGILYNIPYSTAFILDLIIINVLNESQDDIDSQLGQR